MQIPSPKINAFTISFTRKKYKDTKYYDALPGAVVIDLLSLLRIHWRPFFACILSRRTRDRRDGVGGRGLSLRDGKVSPVANDVFPDGIPWL